MPCRTINLGNGATAIVCTRGERSHSCRECGARASKQCDYALRGRASGRTCSVYLCDRCAVVAGAELDYCPTHARVAAKESVQLTLQDKESPTP